MSAEVKSMDMKKTQQSLTTEKTWSLKKTQDFVGELKSEIHKINWTSRDELIAYTKIVVGATFLFGMSIYVLDLLIQGTLTGLNFLLRLIGG